MINVCSPARCIQSVFAILADVSAPFWNRTYDLLFINVKNCTFIGTNDTYPLRFVRHRCNAYDILLNFFIINITLFRRDSNSQLNIYLYLSYVQKLFYYIIGLSIKLVTLNPGNFIGILLISAPVFAL